MPKLKVYATLAEHTELGNIWVDNPAFLLRTIVKIARKDNKKKYCVWCETQSIDRNYLKLYNIKGSGRWHIKEPGNAIVMSSWYREKLRLGTQDEYQLEIEKPNSFKKPIWRLRASLQHPQNAVRLATTLAITSVALGLVGLLLGIISICF